MSLLTVGTVAFDDIETPFGKVEKVVGGAALYISLAAAYFTDDVKIVSVVGDDFPQEELTYLKLRGHRPGRTTSERRRKIFLLGGSLP